MFRILRAAGLAAGLAASPAASPSAAAQDCSLALAFALDVSASVDAGEWRLQRDGLADALLDPDVAEVLLSLPAPAALLAYEWSGERHQPVVAGWSVIATPADLAAFAASLRGGAREARQRPTAIGPAIGVGAVRLQKGPRCDRMVLDVSGDGTGNHAYPPESAYRAFPMAGITVNGLVVEGADAEVLDYYLTRVIRGPGAFVEVAAGYADFARAMRRKILREARPMQFVAAD